MSNPIRPIGSAVALTCTVELNPAVNVPVTVNIVWTGPDEFGATDFMQPTAARLNTYDSLVTIEHIGRNQSGYYTCAVTVISAHSMIEDSARVSSVERVTVGKLPSYSDELLLLPL